MYRRELLSSVGTVAVGPAAISSTGPQDDTAVAVSVNPSTTEVAVGEEFELDLTIAGATDGIAAFEFEMVFDSTTLRVREVSLAVDTLVERVERSDGGLRIEAALGNNPIDPTTSIALATLSVEGIVNEVISVDFDAVTVSDRTNTPYEIIKTTGSSIQVGSRNEENNIESDDNPASGVDSNHSESSATNDTIQFGKDNEARNASSEQRSTSEDNSGPGFAFASIFGALAALYGWLKYNSNTNLHQE